jgi:hypothetical protein
MSFWSWLTGTTPQADQQAQLDYAKGQYDAALQARIDAGTITPAEVQSAQRFENSVQLEDTTAAAQQGFQEGLQQGLDNVLNAPGKVVGAVGSGAGQLLWGVVKNIPWWVWLGAAGMLFVWMGGLELLRGRLARR